MSEYIITGEQLERLGVPDMFTEQEIVRCRDCKHYNGWACEQSECFCCGELTHRVEPDGFCKWAKRRNE